MINQCVANSRMVSIPMRFRHFLNKITRIINRITRKELGKKRQTNGKQTAKPLFTGSNPVAASSFSTNRLFLGRELLETSRVSRNFLSPHFHVFAPYLRHKQKGESNER